MARRKHQQGMPRASAANTYDVERRPSFSTIAAASEGRITIIAVTERHDITDKD